MFDFRPDLQWPGSRFGRSDEEEVPGFRFKPPEDDVPGFRVKPPHEQVPGFRMNAGGSIKEAEATTDRPYSGPGRNPFHFFEQPGTGTNAFTPVADRPPWGGWGMSPYPEDNDNVPPDTATICDRANSRCQQFGRSATPESYTRWIYECAQAYEMCRMREQDPNYVGKKSDYIRFPDGGAVIFRKGYPPQYVPSPRL
jgi:hypothetical protein